MAELRDAIMDAINKKRLEVPTDDDLVDAIKALIDASSVERFEEARLQVSFEHPRYAVAASAILRN